MADAELMRRMQHGDAAAFAALYDRHSADVHALARRVVGNRALAEDVAQETFIALWRSRRGYRPERGATRSWLLSIAHNRAIDATRKRCRRDEPLDAEHEQLEGPQRTDAEVIQQSDVATVAGVVRDLPATQREVIELAYFAGLTQREIATRLQLPLGTVKGRCRVALKHLGTRLAADAVA
jgi:RNA polymerase sigma-70 factor (ECF subfamily)